MRDTGEARGRLTSERRLQSRGAMHDFAAAAPPQILFPPSEAELWAGKVDGAPARGFVLAGRGEGQLSWYIDGAPCAIDGAGAPVWSPTREGFCSGCCRPGQPRACARAHRACLKTRHCRNFDTP